MEKIYFTIGFLLIISSYINCATIPDVGKSSNGSEPTVNHIGQTKSNGAGRVSCRCLSVKENCDGQIIKIVTTNCTEDYQYCCIRDMQKPLGKDNQNDTTITIMENPTTNPNPNTAKTSSPDTETASEKTSTNSTSNPRVIIRIPSTDDSKLIPNENEKLIDGHGIEESKSNSKINMKCICSFRADCPSEYTDYAFGFYCSYDKVHCCQPEKSNEISERKIGGSGSGASKLNGTKVQVVDENQCLCVEIDECNLEYSANTLEERKDTLCPFNQIKCCGSRIVRKQQKVNADETESPYNMSLEEQEQEQSSNTQGQATLTMPNGNVPLGQEANYKITNENLGIPSPVSQSDLVTHYNNQQPNQMPFLTNAFNQAPVQRPPIQEYSGQYHWGPGQEPVYRTSNYGQINSNLRQPITTQIRAFGNPPTPGILDSITSFFFG